MRKLSRIAFTGVMVFVLLGGCSSNGAKQDEAKESAGNINIQQQWSGAHSDITKVECHLIKTKEEWGKVWQLHNSNEQAPEIDFSRQMIVAIFQGHELNSKGVIVSSVSNDSNGVLMRFDESTYQSAYPGDKVTPFGIFVL